jgi:hypothetical protein
MAGILTTAGIAVGIIVITLVWGHIWQKQQSKSSESRKAD